MAPSERDGRDDPAEEPPALDDATVEQRWAELTSELSDLDLDVVAGPASEVSGREDEPAGPRARERPLGPRDYLEPEDEDLAEADAFVPPEPEPLAAGDPVLILGWLATVAPMILGLVLVVIGQPARWVLLGLGAIILCGIGLLLWRMPTYRDPGDDGARV